MIAFILFILLILSLVLGAHYFIFFSLTRFLPVLFGQSKILLFWVILFLGLSFIISIILARVSENVLSRWYYLASSVWLGLAINLFMSSLLIWLLFFLIKISAVHFNIQITAGLIYLLAIFVSVYGMINAFSPQVKELTVPIKDLPVSWENKKIVQLSDLHLGIIHRKKFLNKVIDLVNQQQPELILMTGDLFDGMDGDLSVFITQLQQIKAKNGSYFCYGNHEEYMGIKQARAIIEKANIKILDNSLVNINGLQLVGLTYNNFTHVNELNPSWPTILLNHTPTDIAVKDESSVMRQAHTYWNPKIDFTQAKELGIDLQLSGHTHQGQFFPFNYLTKFIYKGFDYGLKQDGDFNIYISSGVGTWGPPLRLGTRSEIVVITLQRK